MNILAQIASRFIKTLGKHELQPNKRALAKDKAYDLEWYFENKADARKLVLYLYRSHDAPWKPLNASLICQLSVNIIVHKTIWKPMHW